MEYCWVRSCKNFMCYDPSVDLYPLPVDPEERSLWVIAFGLKDRQIDSSTRICGSHFRRKYFLKADTNITVNGSGGTLLSNGHEVGHNSVNAQFNQHFLVKNTSNASASPSNDLIYVAISNDQMAKPTIELSQAKSTATVISAPNSSHEAYLESNKIVHSNLLSSEESSNAYCAQALQPLTVDSSELSLYCKEENLTPEQQKFHADEWMNYVKFTASIHNLPHVSAANGSDVGEQNLRGVTSQELPLLVYSDTAPSTQSLVTSVPNSVASNTPFVLQIPPKISPRLNVTNATVTHCNIPAVASKQPSIFPVKLEKSADKSISVLNEEEILPFISQDKLATNRFNKVKDASPTANVLSALSKKKVSSEKILKNGMGSAPSPSSQSSDTDGCISPELLCNVEVKFEENETDSVSVDENTSASFCSDLASDNSNGPKIVDVISGDAGANEFFKDVLPKKVIESDSKSKDLDSSSDKNVVHSSESSLPKTVTQYSIFSMQKTIAVISSGSVEANIHNLLGVRLHIPPIITERDYGTRLKNRLREENFLTLSPWWMIQKRFLPLNPPCSSCGGKSFRVNSCYEFLDGLCWTCDNSNCRKIYPVKRPKFFDRFPSFTLEELLLLTYHWACKSRIWVIVKDVPVHEERIWSYFTELQEICGNFVNRNCMIGKNTKHTVTVEVSAVKLGKFFVLCAYDRRNKLSRLQALTTEEACGSIKHINILEQWLGNQCTLVTWKKISEEFLPSVVKVNADPSIGHVQNPGRHILNASRYLGKTMVQLFQNICHDQLTLDTLQGVLNEVQWRERNGRTEESAFWGIMNEISRLNDSYIYTEAILGDISKDRFFYKSDVSFRLRWGPFDIGSKTSSTYNISENADETQQLIANEIESSSRVHPVSIVGLVPGSQMIKGKDSITARELLAIRIIFQGVENTMDSKRLQGYNLGLKLRAEGFLTNPIRWFVKNKYIKDETSCYVCQGKSKLVDNSKYPEGVSWLCQKTHCMFDNRYKKPSFFCYFGFKLDIVLAAIFHWAIQSDSFTTVKAIPLNEFNIISIHRKLQQVCAEVSERETFKVGGRKALVEVAFVRFSNCFILGAMERESKISRFRTFSIEAKLHIDEIRKTLLSWLLPGSTVIVNSNKYLGRYHMEERINLVFADKSVTDIASKRYHTLTITDYLQSHIKNMFRPLRTHQMSSELLQVYLDELMWRERYGKTPASAFQSIMRDIFAIEYGVSAFVPDAVETSAVQQAASAYGFSLPLPEVKIAIEKLPEHVINSYTCPASSTDEVSIIEDTNLKKEIKVEVVSDDDEEIEIVSLSPNPQMGPSTSSSSVCGQNDDTEPYFISEKNPVASTSKSEISVNKSEDNRRYSDKCYSRRKKDTEDTSNLKLQCVECKDFVTVDHFMKSYNCSDCRHNIYSTCCQKAFAQHRAYILFGRNIPERSGNYRMFHLSQEWYCLCGFRSREGNELGF